MELMALKNVLKAASEQRDLHRKTSFLERNEQKYDDESSRNEDYFEDASDLLEVQIKTEIASDDDEWSKDSGSYRKSIKDEMTDYDTEKLNNEDKPRKEFRYAYSETSLSESSEIMDDENEQPRNCRKNKMNNPVYVCPFCYKEFIRKSECSNHIKIHTSSSSSNNNCSSNTTQSELISLTDIENEEDKNKTTRYDPIIFMLIYQTINLPFSDVRRYLTKCNIPEGKLTIIRKIRRQVKNRMYAQNCRKRRMIRIQSLATELERIRERKEMLKTEREILLLKKSDMQLKCDFLDDLITKAIREKCEKEKLPKLSRITNLLDKVQQIKDRRQTINEEKNKLISQKRRLQSTYNQLYQHIFKIITEREKSANVDLMMMMNRNDFIMSSGDISNDDLQRSMEESTDDESECEEQVTQVAS